MTKLSLFPIQVKLYANKTSITIGATTMLSNEFSKACLPKVAVLESRR
jgi:hypothetical protein